MIIEVNGVQVEVDDSFADLPEDQKQIQLQEIAASLPPQEAPTDLKYAPAAGALIGGSAGAAFGPKTAEAASELLEPVVKKVPGQAVKNYVEATTNRPFVGGDAYDTALMKAKIAASQPVPARGAKIPMRRGNLSINTQPQTPSFLTNTAQKMVTQPSAVPSRAGSALRLGAAGSLAGKTAQDIQQGNYGDAALHGAGTLATIAGQSRFKPLRILGTGVAAAEALSGLGSVLPSKQPVEEKAMGGVVGYNKGKKVKEIVESGLDVLTKKPSSAVRIPRQLVEPTAEEIAKFVPKPTKQVKFSDAIQNHMGEYLGIHQSDRLGAHGNYMGGTKFPNFQNINPLHAVNEVVWMNNDPNAVNKLIKNVTFDDKPVIWTNYIGKENQHKSNRGIFNEILADVYKNNPNISEEQALKIAARMKQLTGKDLDVRDKFLMQEIGGESFDSRGKLADMFGLGFGRGKDKLILSPNYQKILDESAEELTKGAPTSAIGTRLHRIYDEPTQFSDKFHPDYDYVVHGKDMGIEFEAAPHTLLDWTRNYVEQGLGGKGSQLPHGNAWMSYMRTPQYINDKFVKRVQSEGFAQGGPIGYAGGKAVKKGFENTVKAYKLFRTDKDGNLYPLFVNANKPVPMGEWLKAEAGPLTEAGKVKSKIGDLAYRPGWHSGEYPVATHIGGKSSGDLKAPDFRPPEQVWAEVEHPADIDWQKVAMERAQKNKKGEVISRTAHITDQIPFGGNYRYKTNPNMTGDWIISGDMKVNRILPDEEVMRINEQVGVFDLPRYQPLDKKAEGGLMCLKSGGHSSPAWQRKEGKNPEGGLNAAGRASYNRETGGNLKPPVSAEQAKKSPKSAARRKSFCARMSGMEGPMKDEKGRPTRKALALRKWDC